MKLMNRGVWLFLDALLLVACGGGGSDVGSSVQGYGGDAGSASGSMGTLLNFGAGAAGMSSGHAGQGSAVGGASAAGAAGAGAAGGTGGVGDSVHVSKCSSRPQVYCNGACLTTVGETQGSCSALLLEESQTLGLAVDATGLYFNHANTSVDHLDLTTLQSTSLVTGLNFPRNLLLSGDSLLFTTDWTEDALGGNTFLGTLRSVPKVGGAFTLIASAIDQPGDLALVGSNLYFAGGFGNRTAYSAPLGGQTSQALGGALTSLEVVLFDASAIYFTTTTFGNGISSVPYSDVGTATQVASDTNIAHLFSDAAYLYFVASDSASGTEYYRVSKSGGTSERVASYGSPAQFNHRDGDTLYFVASTTDTDQVLSLPITGGTFTPVASFDWGEVSAITVDATYVYVGTNNNGIVRVKK